MLLAEAQERRDPDKSSAWAYYLAHLYEKYRLPPVLLDDAAVFIEPTELGLGGSPAAKTWRKIMSVDLSFFRSETSSVSAPKGVRRGGRKLSCIFSANVGSMFRVMQGDVSETAATGSSSSDGAVGPAQPTTSRMSSTSE